MNVRWTATLLAAATGLALPGAAAADRTVSASVVAPATPSAGAAALPVLLLGHAARSHRRPVIAAVVSGRRPVRWGSDRLGLDQLRPGDRVTLRLHGRRARSIRLQRSGRGDSFDRVAGALGRAATGGRQTVDRLAALPQSPPPEELAALRTQLTTLVGDLQSLVDDLDASLRSMRRLLPRDAARRSAVIAAQRPYAGGVTAVRDAARTAARAVDHAAGTLGDGPPTGSSGDGGTSPSGPAPLPTGTPGEVTQPLVRFLEQAGLIEFSGGPVPLEGANVSPPR